MVYSLVSTFDNVYKNTAILKKEAPGHGDFGKVEFPSAQSLAQPYIVIYIYI